MSAIFNSIQNLLFKRLISPIILFGLRIFFKLHNNIEVKGLEKININDRLVYIANHVSNGGG